jgi:UDP:flavonoid glycosyltransferase YjiC (YdhE family)
MLAPPINQFRAELGLSEPVRQIQSRWLHAPQLVINVYPEWFNPKKPDWPEQAVNTGFVLFDGSGGAALPEELQKFLDGGDPPVAIITSSGMTQGREFLRESLSAIGALRKRAVFVCPRREMLPPNLPPWAAWTGYASYEKLFPRCCAVIHQGAIGTSAIAIASGTPQIAVPQAADQFNNAGRLKGLGLAPTIRPEDFQAPIVTRALRMLLSAERAEVFRDFSQRVREARPLEKICPMIEGLVTPLTEPAAAPAEPAVSP